MKKIYFIFISILFSSCSKVIDATFLNAKTEAVLQCYISPSDTLIRAILTNATSFIDSEILYTNLYIKDASITISHKNDVLNLVLNPKTNIYELPNNNFIKSGETYSIKVVNKNGNVLTANTTVPSNSITQKEIEIEKSKRGTELVDIRLKWQNSKRDDYIIRPYYFRNIQDKEYSIPQKLQFISGKNFLSSDKLTSNYFTNDLTISLSKNTVFFYIADENYYNYQKTVQQNKSNQDDPFSQTINVATNIIGGKGCFGSFNLLRLDYEL